MERPTELCPWACELLDYKGFYNTRFSADAVVFENRKLVRDNRSSAIRASYPCSLATCKERELIVVHRFGFERFRSIQRARRWLGSDTNWPPSRNPLVKGLSAAFSLECGEGSKKYVDRKDRSLRFSPTQLRYSCRLSHHQQNLWRTQYHLWSASTFRVISSSRLCGCYSRKTKTVAYQIQIRSLWGFFVG